MIRYLVLSVLLLVSTSAQAATFRLQGQVQAGLAGFTLDDSTDEYGPGPGFGLQLAGLVDLMPSFSVGLFYNYMASGPHEDDSALDLEVDLHHNTFGIMARGMTDSFVLQAYLGLVSGGGETRLGPFVGDFSDSGAMVGGFLAYSFPLSSSVSMEFGPFLNLMRITPDNDNLTDASYAHVGLALQIGFFSGI